MSLNRKLNRLIKNRPTYEINQEAFDNQAIAKSRAFGRDRAIQAQESELEQSATNAVSQAKDVTTSTSGLLNTIAAIQANTASAGRNLAIDEARLQDERVQDLYGANQAMIDEKDKAFEYNVNMPYQNQIQALRDRKKARGELVGNIIGAVGNIAGSVIGTGLGK